MTEAQSFVSTEESEDQLRLSTLTREAAVQESQQLLPACDVRKDCPRMIEKKVLDSRSMSH